MYLLLVQLDVVLLRGGISGAGDIALAETLARVGTRGNSSCHDGPRRGGLTAESGSVDVVQKMAAHTKCLVR